VTSTPCALRPLQLIEPLLREKRVQLETIVRQLRFPDLLNLVLRQEVLLGKGRRGAGKNG